MIRFKSFAAFAILLVATGCTTDSARKETTTPNCGKRSASDPFMGYERSGWVAEGEGLISNSSRGWTDNSDIGFGNYDARLLNCVTGEAIVFEGNRESSISPEEFIAVVRKRDRLNNSRYLMDEAQNFKFSVKTTQATSESPVAICGCKTLYPDLSLPWATEDRQ